ncbi:methylthioribulose 1-phosphate dehydratase [Enterobacter kobei]|jgi:methylthioribulose-1-phosphate dehydratase|uniref:Methylthioribulose-1-phosphate dehydratase n=2 Tax=Enterobacter kobei TaxID=208224 RepID=A0ACC8S9M5_9ENTR|nr:methylthioribulose 1-phosphate dehydratase [Enterobacter kobei]MDF3009172.1 methylthioribulose-phosphate dehydratase [Enterobacter kobei]OLR20199.1 methylthioribulose-1-phosphate dehydratase [Enterobacter kobei]BCU56543.1 methylthioribulose-1-phosphate dehydratase [Enterobacter kobei]SIQ51054.1 methylthioribulose-1-phosphate dehydratase [Enterobacter kobei]
MTDNLQLSALVDACHWIGAKGWAPATGGNMSVREDADWCWLSESGKDKGSLTTDDFLRVEIATHRVPSGRTPSAETGLHTLIYRLFPQANAVLHVHTVNATVLSRVEKRAQLTLHGYEMQKSLSGQHTHLDSVPVAIFDNDQDIDALARRIEAFAQDHTLQYGFLLRGHGLTCWGRSVAEARRHLEGLEFLFECEMQRRLLEK